MMQQSAVSVRTPQNQKNYTKYRLYGFLLLTALLLFVVLFAEQLCPYDPHAQIFDSLEAPSLNHLCGTDVYGRDLFSRILIGLRTSVLSALTLVLIIAVTGTAVGVLCGYWGGIIDSLIMRISDVCLAFPGLVFALAIAALLGGGLHNAVIALAVISWPKYARIARSQTLTIKTADYIAAARLAGSSSVQIILRHILPNSLGPIVVTAMLDIGTMMMELAGLSFLGLGAQPPAAELGNMMSGGRSMLQTYPWVILAPGTAMFVAVVIFNLLGDAIRDALDPRSRYKL